MRHGASSKNLRRVFEFVMRIRRREWISNCGTRDTVATTSPEADPARCAPSTHRNRPRLFLQRFEPANPTPLQEERLFPVYAPAERHKSRPEERSQNGEVAVQPRPFLC